MKRTILLTTIPERKKNLAPILLLLRTQADEVRVSFNRYKEIPEIAGPNIESEWVYGGERLRDRQRVYKNELKYNPTGMCLVGQKFLHRYPDKLLYHPDFYQFAAQEIHRLCMSTKKKTFILEDKYVVKHGKHHYGNDWIDKTHYEARKHYKRDRNTKILFAKRPPYGRA